MRQLLATLLLLLAAPAPAKDIATDADRAALALAQTRGALIYAYDQAAWHGTDAMTAAMPDYAQRVGGWVVEGPADRPRLTFVDKAHAAPTFVARFDGGRLVEGRVIPAGAPDRLTPDELRLVAAIDAARAALVADRAVFTCAAKPFNTVVLPPEAPGGPIAVYFLTPQVDRSIPIGGHYRVEVDANGHAGPVRAFSRSCLKVAPPQLPAGAKPVGAVVNSLLDATPTELHVFAALTMHLPIYVVTEPPTQRLWVVDGTHIRGPLPPPK